MVLPFVRSVRHFKKVVAEKYKKAMGYEYLFYNLD